MSFWDKIKNGFRNFMIGRNGSDELAFASLIAALVLMLLTSLTGLVVFNVLSTAAYVYCIFRMFSRNTSKRYAENQKFVEARHKMKTSVSQAMVRAKNVRKYKYFKCPQCGAMLRLPRKVGEVTVTCGKCRNAFRKKA